MVLDVCPVEFIHSTSTETSNAYVFGSWDNFEKGVRMESEGRGFFHVDISLVPGVYLYRYNINGEWEGPKYGQMVERGDEKYGAKIVNSAQRTMSSGAALKPPSELPEMKEPPPPRAFSTLPEDTTAGERMASRVESLAELFNAKGVDIAEYYDVKIEKKHRGRRKGFSTHVKSAFSKVSSVFSKKESNLRPNVYNYGDKK